MLLKNGLAETETKPILFRVAMGVTYNGSGFDGWQTQPNGQTVQDALERALERFTTTPIRTFCSGRTDAGVHGLMQVVHFDTTLTRPDFSWVRGTNAFLPSDVAVQWARYVPMDFHARACALSRRYAYLLLQSPVRPSLEAHRVGWVFYPLDLQAMQEAASYLIGEHDFSSFRAAACQAISPVKTLYRIHIERKTSQMDLINLNHWTDSSHFKNRPNQTEIEYSPTYWRFEFNGSAFLHHMIRNIMGCLLVVGQGKQKPKWIKTVLEAKSRLVAAPTFAADGLYFLGPLYDERFQLPQQTVAFDWLN